MFQQKKIITAIEIGTSKICVLVGESTGVGQLAIIGRGEAPSDGAVIKGEISDMQRTTDILAEVLEEADASCRRRLNDTDLFVMSVTGANISSMQGTGTVFIKSEDRRVTLEDMLEAEQNAEITQLPMDRSKIISIASYFTLDDTKRVKNPVNQVASKLEASVHIIHGESNRLSNFRIAFRDADFEQEVEQVFGGIASAYGVLSEEEQENGVLLVDIGAGTTDYIVVFNQGVLASGTFPLGFDHVANDLSVGLNLSIEQCRRMLKEGIIAEHLRERHGTMEVSSGNNNMRKIPMSSVEKIIDLRIKEIFQIIQQRLKDTGLLSSLGAGGVISGGAALFPRTVDQFRSTFDFQVRVGQPFEAAGAVTGLEDPRYSNVWGALRYGADLLNINMSQGKGGIINTLFSNIDRLANSVFRRIRDTKDAIKI